MILKRLIVLGRYSFKTKYEEGQLFITMPQLEKNVSIQGLSLQEKLHFTIYVPKGIVVENENTIIK